MVGKLYQVNDDYCDEGTGHDKSEYYPYDNGAYRYFPKGSMFLVLEEKSGEIRIDHWTTKEKLAAGTSYLILIDEKRAWINFKPNEPIERWIEIKE